jgi:hypothetical protein
MINGIILLLGNREMASKPGYVQALSLLFTAFVALGLDSYLFGLVTGDTGGPGACRRAWTEAMLAAGLLGVGTVAIIVGFVFLFAVYFRDQPPGILGSSLDLLIMVCTIVRAGVALVVVALIYVTSRSYLLAIFPRGVPKWGTVFLYGYIAVAVLAIVVFVAAISAPLPKRDRPVNRITELVRASNDARFIMFLKISVFGSLAYSVLTVIFASFITISKVTFWNPSGADVQLVAGLALAWISAVPLVPVYLLTATVVPSFRAAPGHVVAGVQPHKGEAPAAEDAAPAAGE